MLRLISLALILGWSAAQAAEVERVERNTDRSTAQTTAQKAGQQNGSVFLRKLNSREWKVGDRVCLFHKGLLAGCGAVTALSTSAGVVRLNERSLALVQGDEVEIRLNSRLPATTATMQETITDHKSAAFDVALGLNAGFNYYYPMAQIQLALSRNFSLGVLPVFASYSATNRSTSFLGGYLTGTYYYTHYAFKGVFFEGGLGLVNISATSGSVSGESTPFGVRALIGWRGRALWDIGLDIGVGAGVQYVFLEQSVLDTTFRGFLPLAQVTLAYSFE